MTRTGLIGLAFCLGLAASGPALAQGRPATVQVDPVVVEPLAQTQPAIGRLVARQAGDVAALVGGPIDAILADVGDRVEEGQVLARVWTTRMETARDVASADLSESYAAVSTAQAQLALAEQEAERLERLRASAAFSQARLDDKQKEITRLRSELAEARAQAQSRAASLAMAELDLELSEIRAPFNGVVAERLVERGGFVNVGTTAFRLVNDLDLEVEADVPAARAQALTPGRLVVVRLGDGSEHDAVVRAVVPQENPLTRTRPARFTPAFPDELLGRLASNQTATVLLPIGEPRDVLTVHKDAVIAQGAAAQVFLAVDGKAQPRRIEIGAGVGPRFEVLSGLAEGDLVVVRGNERLRPMQPITWPGAPQGGAAAEAPAAGPQG